MLCIVWPILWIHPVLYCNYIFIYWNRNRSRQTLPTPLTATSFAPLLNSDPPNPAPSFILFWKEPRPSYSLATPKKSGEIEAPRFCTCFWIDCVEILLWMGSFSSCSHVIAGIPNEECFYGTSVWRLFASYLLMDLLDCRNKLYLNDLRCSFDMTYCLFSLIMLYATPNWNISHTSHILLENMKYIYFF